MSQDAPDGGGMPRGTPAGVPERPGADPPRARRARELSRMEGYFMQPQSWWERRKRAFDRLMEARDVPPKRTEVAWRLCLGDSDKEIGQRFGLTRNGVAGHVRLLFPAFGVHDRRSFRRTVAERMEGESPRPAARSCVHTSFCFSMRGSTTTLANDMGDPHGRRAAKRGGDDPQHEHDGPRRPKGLRVLARKRWSLGPAPLPNRM